jgi:hypothetical protein
MNYDNLPQDPIMLLSFINTKLRDNYSSLDLLCEDMNANKEDIISRLAAVNYEYNKELNKFM